MLRGRRPTMICILPKTADECTCIALCEQTFPHKLQGPVNIHPNILHMIRPPAEPRLGPDRDHIPQFQIPHKSPRPGTLPSAHEPQFLGRLWVVHVIVPRPDDLVRGPCPRGRLVALNRPVRVGIERVV